MWIKKVFNFFGIEVIWEMELFELLLFLFDGVCVVWEILQQEGVKVVIKYFNDFVDFGEVYFGEWEVN